MDIWINGGEEKEIGIGKSWRNGLCLTNLRNQ